MCHTYILQVYCVSMTSASSSLLIKLNRLRRARLKLIKNLQIGFLITLICALLNLENIEILYNLVHHVFHLSLRIYHHMYFEKLFPLIGKVESEEILDISAFYPDHQSTSAFPSPTVNME